LSVNSPLAAQCQDAHHRSNVGAPFEVTGGEVVWKN